MKIPFYRIDSPSEESKRDKPSIEGIDLTQRQTDVAYITKQEERRSKRHDAPLPHWERVT